MLHGWPGVLLSEDAFSYISEILWIYPIHREFSLIHYIWNILIPNSLICWFLSSFTFSSPFTSCLEEAPFNLNLFFELFICSTVKNLTNKMTFRQPRICLTKIHSYLRFYVRLSSSHVWFVFCCFVLLEFSGLKSSETNIMFIIYSHFINGTSSLFVFNQIS